MARFRRVRWIAITVVAATVAGALAVAAEAYADRSATRCAPPAQVATVTRDTANGSAAHADKSWRTGAFRAAGCRAWRKMHPRRLSTRTGR